MRRKEWQTKHYELTTASILHPAAPLGSEEIDELGVKLSLGRRERWGEGSF